MTTIRTTNWKPMIDFYCRFLGMKSDNPEFRYLMAIQGYHSEIRMERVDDEAEQEVIGKLEFSVTELDCQRLLRERDGIPFKLDTTSATKLEFRDPDNNRICVYQEESLQVAA